VDPFVGQFVVIVVVGQSIVIDVDKQWLSLMSIDVMGVFGEVSNVVPLWRSSKHGLQGKMLSRSLQETHRCGHEGRSCLRNKDMKENVNAGNTLIHG
jgi:hypothetical protein